MPACVQTGEWHRLHELSFSARLPYSLSVPPVGFIAGSGQEEFPRQSPWVAQQRLAAMGMVSEEVGHVSLIGLSL